MQQRPTFSFMLPTRKRVDWCLESIRSIYDLAADKTCFEILLAFDDDDVESRERIVAYCQSAGITHQVIVVPRYGYKKLHFYYNTLAKLAASDYLWLWNDDAFFQTPGWDGIMKENIVRVPDMVWDFDSSFPGILPLVPKKYVDTLGHYSLHAHNDTWMLVLFRELLKVWEIEKRITIKHIHTEEGRLHDPEFAEVNQDMATDTFSERDSHSSYCLYFADVYRLARAHFPHVQSVEFPSFGPNVRRIGFVGMGKLGLPVAVGMAAKGHMVYGYDVAQHISIYKHPRECLATQEADPSGSGSIKEMLDTTTLRFVDDIEVIVAVSEIVFVAVQTPHGPEYEGVTRIPGSRKDFDYSYLVESMTKISAAATKLQKNVTVVVISTVLPGTMRKHVMPILSPYVTLVYNPYFIAMGTVLRDFYNPEFVLVGLNEKRNEISKTIIDFYSTICGEKVPIFITTVENAELIKVCYNTMISTKIAFANTVMELCDHIDNTSVDAVTTALGLATRRITSAAYLTGGMGDGGGCHPRDNIAMSWLSREHDLKFDFFESMMMAREQQTEYLATLIERYWRHYEQKLDVCIMGEAFKPNTNLTTGSPSILLKGMVGEIGIPCTSHDHHVNPDGPMWPRDRPHIYFIGTKHDDYASFDFPAGSVIIDPHRYIPWKDHYAALHHVGSYMTSRNRI